MEDLLDIKLEDTFIINVEDIYFVNYNPTKFKHKMNYYQNEFSIKLNSNGIVVVVDTITYVTNDVIFYNFFHSIKNEYKRMFRQKKLERILNL